MHYVFGRQAPCLSLKELSHTVKFQRPGGFTHFLSIWIVKLSICFFLLRLIEGTHKRLRILIWIIMAVNTALNVAALIMWGVARMPIQSS